MSRLAHLPSDAFLPQYLRGERRGHGDHLIPLETNDVDRGKKKTTTPTAWTTTMGEKSRNRSIWFLVRPLTLNLERKESALVRVARPLLSLSLGLDLNLSSHLGFGVARHPPSVAAVGSAMGTDIALVRG